MCINLSRLEYLNEEVDKRFPKTVMIFQSILMLMPSEHMTWERWRTCIDLTNDSFTMFPVQLPGSDTVLSLCS